MDDERLRQRIVLAVDALPVPPAPRRRPWTRTRPGLGALSLAPIAVVTLAAALVVLAVAPLVAGGRPAANTQPSVVADDFSAALDRTRWAFWGTPGTTVVASGGRVELTIPARAEASGGLVNATLYLRCVARGDYEVSVDYTLLEWPSKNGTRFALGEFMPGTAATTRTQNNGNESYGMFGGDPASARTADTSGSLRLARRGAKVIGSHRPNAAAAWTELPAEMGSQFDATFQIFLFSNEGEFGGAAARVAVDNVVLRGDQVICPPQ